MNGESKFERQSRRAGERLADLPPGSFAMTRPLAEATPTPVPSEVAETTAGEREVEALLAVILAASPGTPTLTCRRIAEAIHASPLIDRVRREEGAKVLRRLADQWDLTWNRGHDKSVHPYSDDLRTAARAASVGRGEGL